MASLLCSPDSPSSPLKVLQDVPRHGMESQLFQVVPVGLEDLDDAPRVPPGPGVPNLPKPLPAVPAPCPPPKALPSNASHRRAPRARRKSAIPVPVPPLPPIPDGDLIESFSDNPIHGALQDKAETEDMQEQEEKHIQQRSSQRAGSELEPSAACGQSSPRGMLKKETSGLRSLGIKECEPLPDFGPSIASAEGSATKHAHGQPIRYSGKHIIDCTDYDVRGSYPKRTKIQSEGINLNIPPSDQLVCTADSPVKMIVTARGGSQASKFAGNASRCQGAHVPLESRFARRGRLLLSQHLSQRRSQRNSQRSSQRKSQRLSQKRKAKGARWVLGKEAPAREQAIEGVTVSSAPERPNVLFTGFARSDLHRPCVLILRFALCEQVTRQLP